MVGSAGGSPTGTVVECGLGTSTCAAAGGVCLIERGEISFADKVGACEGGGGVAAVIYNDTTGALSGTLGEQPASIPAVGVTAAAGAALLGQLGVDTTVQARFGGDYGYENGTSMATPHVAGVAALVWGHFPGIPPETVRDALQLTARDIGVAGRDVETGYGLVQARAAYDYLAGAASCGSDAECDDGNVCNGLETCHLASGTCVDGSPLGCDDGDACNGVETCDPAIGCVGGVAPICDDGDECTTDACDPLTGCVHEDNGMCEPPPPECVPDGGACTLDSECCGNKCRGRPGGKRCR